MKLRLQQYVIVLVFVLFIVGGCVSSTGYLLYPPTLRFAETTIGIETSDANSPARYLFDRLALILFGLAGIVLVLAGLFWMVWPRAEKKSVLTLEPG